MAKSVTTSKGPGQADGTFPLVHNVKNKVVWKKDLTDISHPSKVFVGDNGWLGAWMGKGIHIFTPQGKKHCVLNVWEAVSDREKKQYLIDGQIHRFWPLFATFLEAKDARYICLHFWWGKRAFGNVNTKAWCKADGVLKQLAEKTEKTFALEILRESVGNLKNLGSIQHVPEIVTAIILAGHNNIKEAGGALRFLENLAFEKPVGDTQRFFERMETEWEIVEYARFSLRRLGMTPRPYIASEFRDPTDTKPYTFLLPSPRKRGVDRITINTDKDEVRRILGPPDAAEELISEQIWEFDIDDEEPYTLLLQWGPADSSSKHFDDEPEERLLSIIRKLPPKWKKDGCREAPRVFDIKYGGYGVP